jgi:branched-subunit amino acid transport protein
MTTWIVVLAVGLGSFLFRAVPLSLAGRLDESERFDRLIRRAGVATLTALLVTSADHGAQAGNDVALAAALAVGFVLGLRGGSMLRVVLAGSATYAIGVGLLAVLP